MLIENQIERTDHTHLGQLLTYAAGLKAVNIVWIAYQFTDEHRTALDWLNEVTDEGINFFGLEIELWRIGDSPVAPKFNVISHPNDWTRTITKVKQAIESEELTGARLLQMEFWTAFRDFMLKRKSVVHPQKPLPQNWMSLAIGRSNFYMVGGMNTIDKWINVVLVITGPDGKAHYNLLHRQKDAIEQNLGYDLEWLENPGKKESHIRVQLFNADPADRRRWPEYHAWLADKLESFYKVFNPLVKSLRAEDYMPSQLASE